MNFAPIGSPMLAQGRQFNKNQACSVGRAWFGSAGYGSLSPIEWA
jgi:hypothetical protein